MISRFRLVAVLPVVLFLLLAGVFYAAIYRGGDPSEVPSALIGRYVPEFELPPVDGLDRPGLSSADFGDGAAIVNVWASWCVPCRTEMPLLVELAHVAGVPLHGINYKDDPAAARRFLAELGNPFERIGKDATGRAAIDWGVYGVPETYVIDKNGRIALKHVGPLTPEAIADVLLPALRAAR